MDTNAIIKKSNHFVDGCFRFTAYELRIFNAVASIIRTKDRMFNIFYLRIKDIIDDCDSDINYQELEKAVKSILGKTIYIHSSKRVWEGFRFMRRAKYDGEKGTIELEFDKEMSPFLLGLTGFFTKLPKKYYVQLTGNKYSHRLYAIGKKWESVGKTEYDLDILRRMLVIPEKGSYSRFNNLKNGILIPALNEINRKTDILMSIEREIKDNKKVVSIIFRIQTKKDFIDVKKEKKSTSEELFISVFLKKMSDEEFEDCNREIKHTEKQRRDVLQKVIKKHGFKKIENMYWDEVSQIEVDHIDFYFKKIIPLLKS